jgi:hypothetical protein
VRREKEEDAERERESESFLFRVSLSFAELATSRYQGKRCFQALFLNDSGEEEEEEEKGKTFSCFMAPHLAIGNSVFIPSDQKKK